MKLYCLLILGCLVFNDASFAKPLPVSVKKFSPVITYTYVGVVHRYSGDPGELQLHVTTDYPITVNQYTCFIVRMYRNTPFFGWRWINVTFAVDIPAYSTEGRFYWNLTQGEQVNENNYTVTGPYISN